MVSTQTVGEPRKSKVDLTTRTPAQHLAALARTALTDASGNIEYAILLVLAKLDADPSLQKALLDEIVREAVSSSVRTSHRGRNTTAFNAVAQVMTRAATAPPATPEETTKFILLETVLGTSGVKLREARKAQVLREATFHRKQAATMAVKREFYTRIAEALPTEKVTVGEALSETQLRDLYAEARTGYAEDQS